MKSDIVVRPMMNIDGLLLDALEDQVRSALDLEGDLIECGVYDGRSLKRIMDVMADCGANDRTLYGLDTFTGFPSDMVTEKDRTAFRTPEIQKLMFNDLDAVAVTASIWEHAKRRGTSLVLLEGPFHDTLPCVLSRKLSFVHLDCDIYLSAKQCLEALWNKIVPEGKIASDDYGTQKWPGLKKAVDEFMVARRHAMHHDRYTMIVTKIGDS